MKQLRRRLEKGFISAHDYHVIWLDMASVDGRLERLRDMVGYFTCLNQYTSGRDAAREPVGMSDVGKVRLVPRQR